MKPQKDQKSPWGDGDFHVLVTNGKEIFRAYVGSSDLSQDSSISITWGRHNAGDKFFSGNFDNVTGKFTEVRLPTKKRDHASEKEVAKWRVIRGSIDDYMKVGARVRVYFVLKTIDGVVEDFSANKVNTTIKLPQNIKGYPTNSISFLID